MLPQRPKCLYALILCPLMLAFVLSSAHATASAYRLSLAHAVGERYGNIRLLGTLKLDHESIDGRRASELSGLAWDERRQRLYAVSDNGSLVHLVPRFSAGRFTQVSIEHIYPLLSADGRPLSGRDADAEGLQILPGLATSGEEAQLAISFEQRMRIDVFRADGHFLRHVRIPARLSDRHNYRGRNQGLEGLCRHPDLGYLLVPQRPLKGSPPGLLSLYDLADHEWQYAALDADHSSSVALEIMPSGEVLVLERIYRSVFEPFQYALRRLRLPRPEGPGPFRAQAEEIVRFDSAEGWRLDNFEGLAHHRGQRYFMVSDDNQSPLQKTLLVYFEILTEESH